MNRLYKIGNLTIKTNTNPEQVIPATPQEPVENGQQVKPIAPSETITAGAVETNNVNNNNNYKPPIIEEESRMQKESVFVRLTNRIKVLERNQSLSSGYLEELSQRFKKQSEESYSISLNLKKSLNETLSKYKWLQEFSRRESTHLRRSVSDLRASLWKTEMQRGFLIFVIMVQFLG